MLEMEKETLGHHRQAAKKTYKNTDEKLPLIPSSPTLDQRYNGVEVNYSQNNKPRIQNFDATKPPASDVERISTIAEDSTKKEEKTVQKDEEGLSKKYLNCTVLLNIDICSSSRPFFLIRRCC